MRLSGNGDSSFVLVVAVDNEIAAACDDSEVIQAAEVIRELCCNKSFELTVELV